MPKDQHVMVMKGHSLLAHIILGIHLSLIPQRYSTNYQKTVVTAINTEAFVVILTSIFSTEPLQVFLRTFCSLPHHAFVQFQLNVYWQASSFFFFFLLFSLFNLVNFILLSLFACYTNYNIRLFCQLLVFCQVTIHMTFSKPPQFFVC